MSVKQTNYLLLINCRIGSLEIAKLINIATTLINCRIGSLENLAAPELRATLINCRIGSLEIKGSSFLYNF